MRHHDLSLPAGSFTLQRARVPMCFLAEPIPGATADDDGSVLLDIVVDNGRIARLVAAGAAPADGPPTFDIAGRQVWPTLIDMHAHLDKGQVVPRTRPDGTLEGGVQRTIADRRRWTHEDLAARMRFGLSCAYAHGVSALRTHIDSHEALAPRSWEVFRDIRAEWAGRVRLEGVGLVPLAAYAVPWGEQLADRMVADGGVLGCVTDGLGAYDEAGGALLDDLLERFLQIAAERGLDVDLHVDQSDDVTAFALPHIARAVARTKFKGRVVCGHCVNLALQPDEVARETIKRSVDAGLAFVTLPTPMMYLQDRAPGRTPRWRGVTLARELADAGARIAIGGDNCRDAWFPFGDHDMLDTLQQAVRVFQLDDPISQALAMVAPIPSDIIGAGAVGRIVEGANADLILLAARTLNETMCRPQANRIVVRRGVQVTDLPPDYADLDPIMQP